MIAISRRFLLRLIEYSYLKLKTNRNESNNYYKITFIVDSF